MLKDQFISQILRKIIYDDDFKVEVIEIHHTLEVVEISIVFSIVVGGHD